MRKNGSRVWERSQSFASVNVASIDFPLSKITKAKPLRNCWAGLTIVHRSGIFSHADILGNDLQHTAQFLLEGGWEFFRGSHIPIASPSGFRQER